MAIFSSSTITNLGVTAIADGVGGSTLTITRVSVGSGTGVTNPATQTALVSQQMNLSAINLINNNAGQLTVNAVLDSANVGTTFNLTELGVWGKVNSGSEQLWVYAIAQTPYDSEVHATGVSDQQTYFSIPIQIGNVPAIDLAVSGGGTVYNAATVVAGTGIEVTPVTSGGIVTEYIVSTSTITTSTTLNVLPSFSNIAPNFSSIQNALDYLDGFNIASGVDVTINVGAATYTGAAASFNCTHINGQQIKILGAVNTTAAFTSVTAPTGSAGAWSVQLNGLTSTSGITVGGLVNVWNAGGSSANSSGLIVGIFSVSAISGSSITISNGYYNSTFPSLSGTGGNLTPITSILENSYGAGATAVNIGVSGLGELSSIAVINVGSLPTNTEGAAGILCNGPSTISNCGVHGFSANGVLNFGYSLNSSCNLVNCTATICDVGINVGTAGSVSASFGGASHCGNMGLWISGGTFGVWPNSSSSVNFFISGVGYATSSNGSINSQGRGTLINGASLNTGGSFNISSIYCAYNNTVGISLSGGSQTQYSTSGCVIFSEFNVTYDLEINNISIASTPMIGTRVFNVSQGVLVLQGLIASTV